MIFDPPQPPAEILPDRDLMVRIRKGKQNDVKSRDFEEVAEELEIE